MSVTHEFPGVAAKAVGVGAAVGWPFLAFDFMGLAAMVVAAGTFLTAAVGAYLAVYTRQIKTLAVQTHEAVNSTATMLKMEATAREKALEVERDALRLELDRANVGALSKAEGQLIQQATTPAPTPVTVTNPVVPVTIQDQPP